MADPIEIPARIWVEPAAGAPPLPDDWRASALLASVADGRRDGAEGRALLVSMRLAGSLGRRFSSPRAALRVVALDDATGRVAVGDPSDPDGAPVEVRPDADAEGLVSTDAHVNFDLLDLLGLQADGRPRRVFAWLDELITPLLPLRTPGGPAGEAPPLPDRPTHLVGEAPALDVGPAGVALRVDFAPELDRRSAWDAVIRGAVRLPEGRPRWVALLCLVQRTRDVFAVVDVLPPGEAGQVVGFSLPMERLARGAFAGGGRFFVGVAGGARSDPLLVQPQPPP